MMRPRLLFICLLPLLLPGCSSFAAYIEKLQKQSVDDFDSRSANFQPRFQVSAPKRNQLSADEQRLMGALPPRQGEVAVDGVRYYSANGNVCQYFPATRRNPEAPPKSACWINGRWMLAAPVLNTEPVKQ